MNTQFHTPCFGDEFVDVQQQQTIQTKRVRSGMDNNSLDEYQSDTHDDTTTATYNNTVMAQHSPTSMMGVGAVIVPNASPGATTTLAARKQMAASSGVDPNEPPKPLSPYALFFRDTVSAIKQQNPNCSFTELSRIVASMWEALDPVHKNVYQKKNEVARNEYVKQLRLYRQQQLEQQQQQQMPVPTEQLTGNANANSLQTRPAVFTIARANADVPVANNYNNNTNNSNALIAQQQQQQQYVNQQQQLNNSLVQPQQQQQLYLQQPEANSLSNSAPVVVQSNDPSPQQMQLLTEAGSVQKCTRENCNKRAIINPDWEDEYCSNECVVIHCRNVFNGWVQSNLEARKQ